MENTKAILKNPEDYRARAEFMLDCTYGCNGILALGTVVPDGHAMAWNMR